MAGSIPPSTPSDGNLLVLVVPTLADATSPTVLELTAETVVDISCYLTPDGLQVTQDQAGIADERLCSTQVLSRPGSKTFGLSLRGIDNTNSELETEYNAFIESLPEGTDLNVVIRRGLPHDAAVEGTQTVRTWPVTPGMVAHDQPEANSVLTSTISTFTHGEVVDAVVSAP